MDYREKCAQVEAAYRNDLRRRKGLGDDAPLALTIEELLATPYPKPQHGDRWGPWRFDAEHLTLDLSDSPDPESYDYYVQLSEITSGERAIDWIGHLFTKSWATPEVVGQFVTALWDLTGGRHEWSRSFDMAQAIRENIAADRT